MHARVVLGVGKGVLFREVSSFQECPHRERGSTVFSPPHRSVRESVTFRRRSSSDSASLTLTIDPGRTGLTGFTGSGTLWPSLSTSIPTPNSPARQLGQQGGQKSFFLFLFFSFFFIFFPPVVSSTWPPRTNVRRNVSA